MIHFTPIQELGISNSAYSIRDQLRLSPVYSPGEQKYDLEDVAKLVYFMNKTWGVSSTEDAWGILGLWIKHNSNIYFFNLAIVIDILQKRLWNVCPFQAVVYHLLYCLLCYPF